MALTKVNRGGLNTGIADSSNATFLTATSAEGVTLAGTLAVTGVHTVGTNAVATSDGGAATTNIVQGLAKCWVNIDGTGTIGNSDSFNVSGLTDNTTGDYTTAINANMNNATYAVASHTGGAGQNVVTNRGASNSGYTYQTTGTNQVGNRNTSDQNWNDNDIITLVFFGDLA